jgi:uncharacterized protein (UPF0332 family)
MDDATRSAISNYLSRARDELDAARLLIGADHQRIAVSRAYYAVFSSATALLLSKGLVRTKHAGLQAAFGQQFIKTGLIEQEFSHIFTRTREAREEGDYSDVVTCTQAFAEKRLADAARFVARMECYLRDVGAIE